MLLLSNISASATYASYIGMTTPVCITDYSTILKPDEIRSRIVVGTYGPDEPMIRNGFFPPDNPFSSPQPTACSVLWDSSWSHFIASASAQLAPGRDLWSTTRTRICDAAGECEVLQNDRFTSFPFTAISPCCSSCTFTAGNAQVYHWPLDTTTPLITMLANSDGFTL